MRQTNGWEKEKRGPHRAEPTDTWQQQLAKYSKIKARYLGKIEDTGVVPGDRSM